VAEPSPLATRVVQGLISGGVSVATGESLTAGLVAATLAEVPGCSAVLRGGIVAYQSQVKADLLDVSAAALSHGLVSREVAAAMALGAATALGADLGIGTTGVAGPDPLDGAPVGSVWIAAALAGRVHTRHLDITGDRGRIRSQTVVGVLTLVDELLRTNGAARE
jgi:nicotinamide-nucleotide amidase